MGERPLPEGVEKLGAGRYRGRYYGPDGRRHSTPVYGKPYEAKHARDTALSDIHAGRWLDPQRSGITVDTWFGLWMPTRLHGGGKGRAVRPYVLDKDWARYRNHIEPWLGNRPLAALTRFTVETWHADLAAANRNPATIGKAHTLLQTALERAVDDDRMIRNPAAQTAPIRHTPPKWQLVTRPEFDRLLGEIPQRYQIVVLTAVMTGLRWSELVGLTRADYNPLRKEIVVQRGTVYHKGQLITDRTKSGRERTLPVVAELAAALNAHIASDPMTADARLFVGARGGTLRHPYFMESIYKPAADRAELAEYVYEDGQRRYRGVRFHDLRHSFVSWLLDDGTPIHQAKELAGHVSITTTQLYAHTNRDELRAAMDRTFGVR